MYEGLEKLEIPRTKHPGAKRAFRVGLALFVALTLAIGATGAFVYRAVNQRWGRGAIDLKNVFPALPGQPFNVLVMGSDRRDVVTGSDRKQRQFKGGAGARSDTLMLFHFDPEKNTAVVLSLPRDLRVQIPGYGNNKINAAYAFGGTQLIVDTVRKFTGLEINHYLDINFASFREIVDRIGGVDIYVNEPLYDKKSGLNITKKGCVHMDGNTALSFVRARNIYANADLGRIQTQQRFLRALMAKGLSLGLIFNPGKLLSLTEAIGAGVQHDSHFNPGLARTIAQKLSAGGKQKSVDFRIVPANGQFIGGVSYLIPKHPQADLVFAALKNGTELPPYGKTSQSVPVASDVVVKLINATGTTGIAATQQERLRGLGYHVPLITSGTALSTTTIQYDPNSKLKADLVHTVYPYAKVEPAPKPIPADVVVTFGSDSLNPPSPSATATAKPTKKKTTAPSTSC